MRWTPYWSIAEGTGCVEESPTGFTRVTVPRGRPAQDRRRLLAAARAQRRPALRRPTRRHQRLGGSGRDTGSVQRDPACASASCRGARSTCLVQFAVIAAAYTAWRYARGAVAPDSTRRRLRPRPRPGLGRALAAQLIEADVQSWAVDPGWAAEVARWGYANLHFKGSCLALLVIYFGYRGSFGFVRNTVIAAMAHLAARLLALPDGPAALPRGAGPGRRQRGHRQRPAADRPGQPALQPGRGGALDARRPRDHLRRSRSRCSSRPAWLKVLLLRLSAAHDLRRRRDAATTTGSTRLFGAARGRAGGRRRGRCSARLNPDWAFATPSAPAPRAAAAHRMSRVTTAWLREHPASRAAPRERRRGALGGRPQPPDRVPADARTRSRWSAWPATSPRPCWSGRGTTSSAASPSSSGR